MAPSLSIIVPVYNTEKYIDRCIESVINQTYKNIEIILVDDGSTDNCPPICENYAKRDSRIKVIHKKNQGLGYARNSGISIAQGEYLGFIDSDDYITPDFYENLINGTNNNSYDAVICGLSAQKGNSKLIGQHIYAGKFFDKIKLNTILLPSTLGSDEYGNNYSGMSVCKCIFKRSVIEQFNIKFVSERDYISEDAIFCIDFFSRANNANIVNGAGYFYCYNESSLTHKYNKNRFNEIKKLCKFEIDLINKYNLNEICKYRILNTFMANVRVVVKHEVYNYRLTKKKQDKHKIKEIVRDDYLQSVLKNFDYSNLPTKQRIFCLCLKLKLWRAVLLFADLQNKSK